jgi:NAD-dependent dihydropyrimidine dehydrogenase PreA subunit
MTYVVTSACIDVKDRSCIAECPVDCIYRSRVKLHRPERLIAVATGRV